MPKYFYKIREAIATGMAKVIDDKLIQCHCGSIMKNNSFYCHLKSNLHIRKLMLKKKSNVFFINPAKITNLDTVKNSHPEWFINDYRLLKNRITIKMHQERIRNFWKQEKLKIKKSIEKNKEGAVIVKMD